MPESGWLARQLDRVREESEKLPSWMQYAPKQEKDAAASKSKSATKAGKSQAKKRG
jgi:uncharacterized protein YbaA (DUF1428 family)